MVDKYVQSLLAKNEQIKMMSRQHWLVLVRELMPETGSIIAIVLLTTLGWLVWVGNPMVALAYLFVLLPLISMVKDILVWSHHQYIVTNRRVIQVFGIFTKNVTDSSLEKVNDVKMEQSFWGRLFDYGNIEILTASELGINRFTRLQNPIQFKTAMLDAKEEMKDVDADVFLPPKDSPIDPRLHLRALRQSGVISQEEYDDLIVKLEKQQDK